MIAVMFDHAEALYVMGAAVTDDDGRTVVPFTAVPFGADNEHIFEKVLMKKDTQNKSDQCNINTKTIKGKPLCA